MGGLTGSCIHDTRSAGLSPHHIAFLADAVELKLQGVLLYDELAAISPRLASLKPCRPLSPLLLRKGEGSAYRVRGRSLQQQLLFKKDRHEVRPPGGVNDRQCDITWPIRVPAALAGESAAAERGAVGKEGEGRLAVADFDHQRSDRAAGDAEVDVDAVEREGDLRRRIAGNDVFVGMAEALERLGLLGVGGKEHAGWRGLER